MSLGLVLTPYGKVGGGYPPAAIDYTYKGATNWYGSVAANEARFNRPGVFDPRLDPQWNQRGEAGYYYDSALGRGGEDVQSPGLLGRGLARGLGAGMNIPISMAAGASTLALIGGGIYGYRRAEKNRKPKFWRTIGWGLLASVAAGAAARMLGIKGVNGTNGVGAIPTDFELATRYGYLPVMSGWIKTQQGYATGPWLPPHGNTNWAGYPTPLAPLTGYLRKTEPYPNGGLMGFLRDGSTTTATAPAVATGQAATVEDVMGAIAAHNDRAFALALVSTTAVTVSALLGVFRTLKLIKQGG